MKKSETCAVCGADISGRGRNAKYCVPCVKLVNQTRARERGRRISRDRYTAALCAEKEAMAVVDGKKKIVSQWLPEAAEGMSGISAIIFSWHGDPVTKKNSQRLVKKGGRTVPIPSDAFRAYQDAVGWYTPHKHAGINRPVNVRCVYYMRTKRCVDLLNLLGATMDILVHYGVLADDNVSVVVSHDGSLVRYDPDNPRVEITIEDAGGVK